MIPCTIFLYYQLTRPTDIALAASSLDEIIKFLDDEYENMSLLTSVLVKLSRKFMEPNSYTKLKAMLIVHKMLLSISKEKNSFKIVQALEALRKETDEKFDIPFFSAESLENVVVGCQLNVYIYSKCCMLCNCSLSYIEIYLMYANQ